MKHTHKYETFVRRQVSIELKELGIESAEVRKCGKCGQEMPFLMTKKGHWTALFREEEIDQQNILMA